MRKTWHRFLPTKSFVEQHMQRQTREPFFTANNVRNLHQMVIHHVGHMVRGQTITTLIQHLIINLRRVDHHPAAN